MSAVTTKAAARRARVKLFGSLMTTYGYALVGAAAIQPLLAGSYRLTAVQAFGCLTGLAGQALAIYIASNGEPV